MSRVIMVSMFASSMIFNIQQYSLIHSPHFHFHPYPFLLRGTLWSWSYGSWIYNYLCNQCLSPLKVWVAIPLRRVVLDTSLCGKVCQGLAAGHFFSPGTPVSSTNIIDHHDIAEILLKVALHAININRNPPFPVT
jgi:hypothetical protein